LTCAAAIASRTFRAAIASRTFRAVSSESAGASPQRAYVTLTHDSWGSDVVVDGGARWTLLQSGTVAVDSVTAKTGTKIIDVAVVGNNDGIANSMVAMVATGLRHRIRRGDRSM
jgi:hypothetical protein